MEGNKRSVGWASAHAGFWTAIFALASLAQARTIYVDANATGSNDGSSWTNAYQFLQDALADANMAAKPVEIRVAEGVYRPDQGKTTVKGDRTATFRMLNGVTIQGRFAGSGVSDPNADPNARDVVAHPTILSGDLAGNDVLSEDPNDFVFPPNAGVRPLPTKWCMVYESTRRENSVHVVTSSGVDANAVLDGLTIMGGNAYHPPYVWADIIWFDGNDLGGGVFNHEGSPTIRACIFTINSAAGYGGAMCNSGTCNPVLADCHFIDDYALFGGGAIKNGGGVRLKLTRCLFEGNSVWWDSGAAIDSGGCQLDITDCRFTRNYFYGIGVVFSYKCTSTFEGCEFTDNSSSALDDSDGEVVLRRCVFRGNIAVRLDGENSATVESCLFTGNLGGYGGGLSGYAERLTLRNCLFSGNRATEAGGGLRCGGTSVTIANCTFSGNRTPKDGGAIATFAQNTIVENCILWDNQAAKGSSIHLLGRSTPSVTRLSYCLLQGSEGSVSQDPGSELLWGLGNIDADPCFATLGRWDPNSTPDDPNDDLWVNGDYHLKSQAGRWDPSIQEWVLDTVTSPCIDAGDPNSSVGDEPAPNGGRVNMGAYGGTAQASKSYAVKP